MSASSVPLQKDERILRALGYIVFDHLQVQRYFERIKLPLQHRHAPGPVGSGSKSESVARSPGHGIEFLTALIRHHLSSVPFENLSLHYSPTHAVTISHDALYEKVVTKAVDDGRLCGRGGYCMENNGLFLAVLRSLGFDVYPTGARIGAQFNDPSLPPIFEGWSHQVNIVRIGTMRYVVDVGLGPATPTRPIPLDPSSAIPTANVAPSLMRLRRGSILDNTNHQGANEQMWTYEVQHAPIESSPWIAVTCFSEVEFLQDDFEVMNHFTSTARRFWMNHKAIAALFILDESGDAIGTTSMAGSTFKRRIHGKSETLAQCQSESERIEALEKHLGIILTRDEKRGIFGLPSALSGAALYG